MTTRMLIDASHAEETRVVCVQGNRLQEFDFESASKKQLKGNIYLAKVTRVEPSLQAAFVEYGGNRHGFLAFNEIHPDYYQIPVADREALLAEEAQQVAEDAARDEERDEENGAEAAPAAEGADVAVEPAPDALDEVPRPRSKPRFDYKIQEVIKKRQILLVQVVKEERGNKGAALTTYLSLAGRYCVLMPNTARGGGISRKIANQVARRKLKTIVGDLDVPEGMGVIVRTAGMNRTKSEIKRDFEYLLRVWDNVRQLTLESTAPCLVYEEANLVKRAIRDLYSKDIDEIQVEGEDGYRIAKDFMRIMLPSHAKKVRHYRNRIPLLHRYKVEAQLDSMHDNTVQLKSGGYIVLNPTEALVAIDVNSGRATREHNIEETALHTNLEAAEEVARQLRLRDLAGLIVIDFIDMEEHRNNRTVERRLKECLKADRARIQVGRISSFGLLEMSRQRLRPSLQEASSNICPHCNGSGQVRSTESTALRVLRAIEEEGIRERAAAITVHVPAEVAFYIFNRKRDTLRSIEERYEMTVTIYHDPALIPPNYRLDVTETRQPGEVRERVEARTEAEPEREPEQPEVEAEAEAEADAESEGQRRKRRRRRSRRRREEQPAAEAAAGEEEAEPAAAAEAGDADEEAPAKRRRRSRRGRRRRTGEGEGQPEAAVAPVEPQEPRPDGAVPPAGDEAAEQPEASPEPEAAEQPAAAAEPLPDGPPWSEAMPAPAPEAIPEPAAAATAEPAPEPAAEPETEAQLEAAAEPETEAQPEAAAGNGSANGAEEPSPAAPEEQPEPVVFEIGGAGEPATGETPSEPEAAPKPESEPKRRGWWQRRFL